MSYFTKVKEFMQTAGQNDTTKDLTNKKLVDFRVSLIEEEFNELKEAIKNNDRTEVIDALVDMVYVICGAGVAFDFDFDKAFDIVQFSNMSKFCSSQKEAELTVNKYLKSNAIIYDSPCYREHGEKWVVFNKSTGKILKNINYIPAHLKGL